MSDFLGFLLFVPPLFGLLAAIHFHSVFRSRVTIWLLVGSIVVLSAAAVQLLAMVYAIAIEPTQGTVGWKLVNLVGYTMWPQTLGNLLFFAAVYFLARQLRLGRGAA